ncbi:Glucokinase [Propionibacterium australiense]|uniref:ROK family signature n=1 Tax=Propionibacterium australiense TaxID=119981 RepID=A0A383S7G4_9ACTN|nr:ROK family signature [Propionibacterium australiense]VEH89370.1 Glucokinase [Propionibacterium australiense]
MAHRIWQTPSTRAGLQSSLAMSRTSLGAKLGSLLGAGLVRESDEVARSGGRPAHILEIAPDYGIIAAADIGEQHSFIALCSMEPTIMASREMALDVSAGPDELLGTICHVVEELTTEPAMKDRPLLCLGLSLPAPVDWGSRTVSGYSVLREWDGYDIQATVHAELGVPVFVENDVNAMALTEKRSFWRSTRSLFYVKIGRGIGSAIFMNGELYRGAQGAAGDIGHIQLASGDAPTCRCGNRGCLESLTAGWALERDLRRAGVEVSGVDDIVALAQAQDMQVLRALRQGGRLLGETVAQATSLLNPEVIVVGGSLASSDGLMLAGVRQVVYERALPLATKRLHVVSARSGPMAGVLGAAQLAADAWFTRVGGAVT